FSCRSEGRATPATDTVRPEVMCSTSSANGSRSTSITAGACSAPRSTRTPDARMALLEERYTTHEGRRLRYLIGGTGPAMLLCHGFIGSAENFDDWFCEVIPRRTVVVPYLPIYGESDPLAGKHVSLAQAPAALYAAAHACIQRN